MDPSQRPNNPQPGDGNEPYRPSMPKLVPFRPELTGETPPPRQPQQPPVPTQGQAGYTSPAPGMGMVVGGADPLGGQLPQHGAIPEPVAEFNYKPPSSARKVLLFTLLPLLLLAAGAAAYYYLVYIPGKPEYLFTNSLKRTGIALQSLSATINDPKKTDKFQFGALSGSAVVEGPDGRRSGTLTSKYNADTSTTNLTYSPDDKGKDLVVQALTSKPGGATYPDLYLNIAGMAAVGLNKRFPDAVQYDGKWLYASQDFWKKLIPDSQSKDTKKNETFSRQDVAGLFKIAVDTSSGYVFTGDASKNALVIKSVKGTENLEGQPTFRYAVGFNKERVRAFCKDLGYRMLKSDAYNRVPVTPQGDVTQLKKQIDRSCDLRADQIRDTDTIDMWVNRKTKLVSQVRVSDRNDKGNYYEVGQKYAAGNDFPMYVTINSDKQQYNAKLTLDIDFDKTTAKATVATKFRYGSKKDQWKINLTLAAKPYDDEIKITKPKDAETVPMDKVLDALGFGRLLNNGTVADAPAGSPLGDAQAEAKDAERRRDLKAIQLQLEAYFAQNAQYPSLADINSASWRKQNMPSLSDQSLADPDGKLVELLNGKSTSTMYGYELSDCDASSAKCQGYILTTMLSTGGLYTLNSLN